VKNSSAAGGRQNEAVRKFNISFLAFTFLPTTFGFELWALNTIFRAI